MTLITASSRILKIVAIAAFVLGACEPAPEDLFVRRFVMRKGEHYSTPRLAETLQSSRLRFVAKFQESAKYNIGEAALQSNLNKLLGFSDCNSLHHENSARFAWRWFNDQLEIHAYCYVNGARTEQFLGAVDIGERNVYEIEISGEEYIFYLNDEKIATVARGNTCDRGIYYMLYPYFGGSVPAPHDVSIELEILR